MILSWNNNVIQQNLYKMQNDDVNDYINNDMTEQSKITPIISQDGSRIINPISMNDDADAAVSVSFERTKMQYQKLQSQSIQPSNSIEQLDPIRIERERIYDSYKQLPANVLKNMCIERQLNDKGRKPDLAQRLTQDDITSIYGLTYHGKEQDDDNDVNDENILPRTIENNEDRKRPRLVETTNTIIQSFAGLYPLSNTAQNALSHAQFIHPTSIQARAIPLISSQQSVIIHAATGSGKTLAYLLPYTEKLWDEIRSNKNNNNKYQQYDNNNAKVAFILLPSRELAAQVAGIATILSPPGTVRFVTRPINLMSRIKQERTDHIIRNDDNDNITTRIYIGSAKVIYQSLYGDGRMPAAPTTKPEAMYLLQNTEYLVLDEVDRLLGVVGGNMNINNYHNHNNKLSKVQQQQQNRDSTSGNGDNKIRNTHEKPAAILTAAIARLTLGKATTVAASATVGRPLRRELARCMGLTPQECPIIVRDDSDTSLKDEGSSNDDTIKVATKTKTGKVDKVNEYQSNAGSNVGRAVTIPSTVHHYVIPVVDGTSPGKVLTCAFTAIQSLGPHRRMLLVLTKNFGITTQNAIGALKHFKCQPEPISLLDALETMDGSQAMMEVHRQVTGVIGVGGSQSLVSPLTYQSDQARGYLLVTGEDSVRGLHLDGLDIVLVASRSAGPDEYTHIAGRTGRAGKSGSVINIVNEADVSKVTAWEKMLNITFTSCTNPKSIGSMIQ